MGDRSPMELAREAIGAFLAEHSASKEDQTYGRSDVCGCPRCEKALTALAALGDAPTSCIACDRTRVGLLPDARAPHTCALAAEGKGP